MFLSKSECIWLLSVSFQCNCRNTWLGNLIPFDDAISYHKHLGRLGFGFATVHSVCHAIDIKNWGDASRRHLYDLAFPSGPPQPTYADILTSQVAITGISLYCIMLVAYAFALDFPRKSKILARTKIAEVRNCLRMSCFFLLRYICHAMHPCTKKKSYDNVKCSNLCRFWLTSITFGTLTIFSLFSIFFCFFTRALGYLMSIMNGV